MNPEAPNIDVQLQYLNDEANRLGIHVQIVNASGETDFGAALDVIAQRPANALVVANDGFLNSQRDRLVALTMQDHIPAAFANREFVEAGGLMSYGPSLIEAYRQAGAYAGRILQGEKPADLPVRKSDRTRAGDQCQNGPIARTRNSAGDARGRRAKWSNDAK